ncbi:hypothetical protein RJ639_045753 [Escallonia herrerae]|uniref:CCHC-type domain-containing protein n=1 Tax=Escallonia herrerae TaxID=1293975 RepID=A0AA88W7W2_9ASTE|nr:hypothetical protein RJ639_045753 [Escallonia herrerae]
MAGEAKQPASGRNYAFSNRKPPRPPARVDEISRLPRQRARGINCHRHGDQLPVDVNSKVKQLAACIRGVSKSVEIPSDRVHTISEQAFNYLRVQSGAKILVAGLVGIVGTPEQVEKAEQLVRKVVSMSESDVSAMTSFPSAFVLPLKVFAVPVDSLINKTNSLHCTDLDDLVPDEDSANKDYGLTLLAKIICSKKSNSKVVQTILQKSWNPTQGMKIQTHHDNIDSIIFNHEWDKNRIMDHRPWSVMSSHVVVRDWPHQLNLDEIEFTQSPFWIRVKGLPPILMTKQNAEKIGSKIGKVLEVDFTADGNLAWLRFLQIQVQIDITKPLHTSFNRIKDNRQKMWIRLQYERLPDFCFSCGRLGHTDRNCPHKLPIPPETMASPYGPWPRADNSDECPRYACWSPALVSTQTPQILSMEANSG